MATRENQGLQIALILLVFVVIGLAVFTYYFYSSAETARNKADDFESRLAQMRQDRDVANFKVQALEYMISDGNVSADELTVDLDNKLAGISGDEGVEKIRAVFVANMDLFGDNYAEKRNYANLPAYLISVIQSKNKEIEGFIQERDNWITEKKGIEDREQASALTFKQGMDEARTQLAAQEDNFRTHKQEVDGREAKMALDMQKKDDRINTLIQQNQAAETKYTKQIDDLERKVDAQRVVIQGFQTESFEKPDAVVTAVNQDLRLVYINVGSRDGLRRQQTFSVYDKGQTAVTKAESKGAIEVVQVLDDHLALCRIVEDDTGNLIIPGDVVHTPAWGPGRRVRFVLAGMIDVNGDGKSDEALLVNLIRSNGGVIEDEVTPQTRWVVQGELKSAEPMGEVSTADRQAFNTKIGTAQQIGVDLISPDKLLAYMGWKGDIRTVSLGRGANPADFQRDSSDGPNRTSTGTTSERFRKRTPPRGRNGAFN